MTEIIGEVDHKELGQIQPPGLVRPPQNDSRYIPLAGVDISHQDGASIAGTIFVSGIIGSLLLWGVSIVFTRSMDLPKFVVATLVIAHWTISFLPLCLKDTKRRIETFKGRKN